MQGNAGANRLAQVLQKMIVQGAAKPETAELGTIQADMSLQPDHFNVPIPQGEYLVGRSLFLEPGDRVLIIWVNDGTDPVVVDVVTTS